MDLKRKTIKSLRNIHKETATELKNCPQRLTNEYFYSYMRFNAFKLSNSHPKSKSKPTTPNPASTALNKHNREPQTFHRFFSPKKRITILKNKSILQDPKPSVRLLESLENSFITIPDRKEVSKNEKTFNYLSFDKDNKSLASPDYRKKFDRMFKGKISKTFLKFND